MNRFEIFSLSLYNIKQHTLRTFLTITGIIISTFIVTFFLIISDTFKYTFKIAEKMIGGDVITVDKYDWEDERHNIGELLKKRRNFSYTLIRELKEQNFVLLSSSVYENNLDVEFKEKKMENIKIYGVEPAFFVMHNYKINNGRNFNYIDLKEDKRVCVIGYDIMKEIGEETLEKFILIGGVSFMVIGVLKKIGNYLEMKPDEVIIIPITTYERYFLEEGDYSTIEILAGKKDERSINLIDSIVGEFRKGLGEEGGYAINTLEKRFGFFKGVSTNIFKLLLIISLISLLVGCIGIANIMIASSSERINEIGILKAIGGSDIEIFVIFIFEPILLGLLGASIGVPIATVLATLLLLSSKTTGFIFRFPFFNNLNNNCNSIIRSLLCL